MKFTDKSIQALKPRSERYEVWSDGKDGFGIRVTAKGVKSFIWMYRFEGTSKRLTLGNYPKMSLFEAGTVLAEARNNLNQSIDPGLKIITQRRDNRQAILIETLVVNYLDLHAKPRKRSADEDERILYKDIVPRWGKVKAKDLAKKDVLALLDEIVERGAPIIANRTLACIRKMYNWAISRDILESNPCLFLKAPSREAQRDRVLSKTEIASFWNNLPNTSMSPLIKLALKFQLATAQRKGEVLSAKWPDIDIINKIWIIPSENSKNRIAHRIPLSDLACTILDEIKEHSRESAYLFPSQKPNQTIRGSSVDHALRNNRALLGIEDITPHDLRRSAASHMASVGVNRLVISKILNHIEQSVTSIYDRYSYDAEKKEALDKWGQYLSELIES
ncbi:MAG: tyrosine-type recombinase/integrase [Pseudomonadota bacterium]